MNISNCTLHGPLKRVVEKADEVIVVAKGKITLVCFQTHARYEFGCIFMS